MKFVYFLLIFGFILILTEAKPSGEVKEKSIEEIMDLLGSLIERRKEKEDDLLTGDEILHLKPFKDKTNDGKEIDELMPSGGGDEIGQLGTGPENVVLETRFDYDKTIDELMPESHADERDEEKRNAVKGRRWTDGIVPFELSDEIRRNENYEREIYEAMREWESATCVKFQPAKDGQRNKIHIRADKTGCWSMVGMIGGTQTVSLQRDACMTVRVILHELGHALGFHHEQTRKDRDEYLTVFLDRVIDKQLHNYRKVSDEYLDESTPYDYLSIMHYGKYSFAKTKDTTTKEKYVTMLPKNRCYTELIGKARHLSYYDHKLMNKIYGCTSGCGRLRCKSDCYATRSGSNDSCHCVCLDNSNNDCEGGSCFAGDKYNNCPELRKNSPGFTCYRYEKECCETCKGFKQYPQCRSVGDRYTSCRELAKSPAYCERHTDCCHSCAAAKEAGQECQRDYFNNCASLAKSNPSRTCRVNAKECCLTCKNVGIGPDPNCPKGNQYSNCDDLIRSWGKDRICQDDQFKISCCYSCSL